MNKIIRDDKNFIDAIFVSDINKVMLCQIENPDKPGTLQKFNLKSIVKSLSSLKDDGLKYETLEFDDGFVISYIVKNSLNSPEAIIGFITGFITTTLEYGILKNRFLFFCNREFNALKGKCC